LVARTGVDTITQMIGAQGSLRCAHPSDGEAAMRGIFGSERYAMV
jgi:hypothetical protein